MTIAHFDCFAGAAGDMIVGALLDAGADIGVLRAEVAKLSMPGCGIATETVQRGGLAGVRFNVNVEQAHQPHRHLGDILATVRSAGLDGRAGQRAQRIFTRLAEAEAKVHHIAVEQVHFHEVGAVDSIVDVVAACAALESLGIDRVTCSPIPLGSGTVACEHGQLPLPSPATAELLVAVPIAGRDIAGEVTTPTAAAILTTLAESYGRLPAMELSGVGYGAGARADGPLPNLLRVFVGRPGADESDTADTVVELSANVDDCTGEIISAAMEELLAAGCLDAWAAPIFMKKSRPAWMITALCRLGDADGAERILFAETTTFGVRRHIRRRSKLQRDVDTVETPYGPVRVKTGRRGPEVITAAPEFADCLAAARAHHVSVREVMAAAEANYREAHP